MVKEFAHIRRQRSTLFFMLVVPVMQTIIFGYAIDTQIEHIPLVVFDQDGRTEGRRLVDAFVNTRRFELTDRVYDDESFRREMTSGRARVGLRIPPDYSDRLLRGEQVGVQVLIDGSDSQVATTALNAAKLLGIQLSIQMVLPRSEAAHFAPSRDPAGAAGLPIDVRPRLLYNPDLESSHFFVPGLIGIILQLVTLFLTSFAVVRERELGTLEQLFVTPVGRTGLLLGKLLPYAIVGFVELLMVICVMVYVFRVPIHGSVPLLLSLAMLFMVCSLSLGLLVSTLARTQLEAMQFAFVIMLPSVLLSGFVFPRRDALADLHHHVWDSGNVLHRDPPRHRVARRGFSRSAALGRRACRVRHHHHVAQCSAIPQATELTRPAHTSANGAQPGAGGRSGKIWRYRMVSAPNTTGVTKMVPIPQAITEAQARMP